MLARILSLSLVVLLLGCKTSPVTSEQFGEFAVGGLDRTEQDKCFHALLKGKAHTPTWHIVSTAPLMTGELIETKGSRKQAVTKNLRSVRITVRGKSIFNTWMKVDYVCLFGQNGDRLRYMGQCMFNSKTKRVEFCQMIPHFRNSVLQRV